MQGGGAYIANGGSAELAAEGARSGLQTTALDDLPEYTLAVGSGSNAAGPGFIEDAALAQRSTAPRQGRLSAMLSRRSRSSSASSEGCRGSVSSSKQRGSLGEASAARSSGKRRSSLGVSVDVNSARRSQASAHGSGKLGRWSARRSSTSSREPSSPLPAPHSPSYRPGSVPDI